jgi:putative transposase
VHAQNLDVCSARKVWRQLQREGFGPGRDRIARLMSELQLPGARRDKKKWQTTFPDRRGARPADLGNRQFTAAAPNRLWAADLTYVSTWKTVAYAAFIVDVSSLYSERWPAPARRPSSRVLALASLHRRFVRRRWKRAPCMCKSKAAHSALFIASGEPEALHLNSKIEFGGR